MKCSSFRISQLNIYFRFNEKSKLIVDFSFPWNWINEDFWTAIRQIAELPYDQMHFTDVVFESHLRDLRKLIPASINLVFVPNQNNKEAA
jgi:hypothetical protein